MARRQGEEAGQGFTVVGGGAGQAGQNLLRGGVGVPGHRSPGHHTSPGRVGEPPHEGWAKVGQVYDIPEPFYFSRATIYGG